MLQIENQQVPPELAKVILDGKCVVFIGSGPEVPVYGRWHEVVNALCARCGSPCRVDRDDPRDKFLDAALEAKGASNEDYYAFLGERFGRPADPSVMLYNTLLSLPFASYLTTNFAPLLALHARTARRTCVLPPSVYPTLDRMRMGERSVHYLHGLVEENGTAHEGSIVFARDEFDEAYGDNSPLMNLLIPTLANDPIVFVGCELQEPTMQKVFRICSKHQDDRLELIGQAKASPSNPPRRYIMLGKPQETDREDTEEKMEKKTAHYGELGVTPIWYDPRGDHAALRHALGELAELPDVTPYHGW